MKALTTLRVLNHGPVPVGRRNLLRERGRFAIAVGGVALAVLLILVVLSLYRGWTAVGGIIEDIPGDLWVMQRGTTDPFHSFSLLDSEAGDQVAAIEGVGDVRRVWARNMTILDADGDTIRAFAWAIDLPPSASPRAEFTPAPGTVAVDAALGRSSGLARGDTVFLNGVPLQVSRVYSGGNAIISQFVFVSVADAAVVFGFGDSVNYLLVTAAQGTEVGALAQRITGSGLGLEAVTGREFASRITSEINESFLPVVTVLLVIGFVVGATVVGLTAYTATIERSRDYGVMKAIGASGPFLYRVVVSQSLVVGLTGFLVGLAGGVAVSLLAARAVPEFVTDLRWYDALWVLGATLFLSVLASYLPVRRINRIDPASAFRA